MSRLRKPFLLGAMVLLAAGAAAGEATRADRGPRVAAAASGSAGAEDLGPADPSLPLERMVLVFPLRNAADLEALLTALHDPGSPRFRRWLTPAEFGARFGAAAEDLESVAAWLRDEGFTVERAPAGRTALLFSGRAGDVERAFGTSIHLYAKEGRTAVGNERPMTLPGHLAGVRVHGLLPVDGFQRRTPFLEPAAPLINVGNSHGLGPADFAAIYGVEALLATGTTGAGRRIVIPARTNIRPEQTRLFRDYFGLPARDPVVVVNGPDPGVLLGNLDLVETNLDVQWSGGVATDADVVVVVSQSTATTDGIDLSSLHAVDQDLGDVLSLSYGACEQHLSAGTAAFFVNLWAQAAAQGMAVVVSAGDSGPAGCERYFAPAGTVAAVNGLGSSPYVTVVGGTQFDDGGHPEQYWSDSNDPATRQSARGPIPEAVWNESGSVPGGSGVLGTGGGASLLHARPSWQSVPGTPAGDSRLVPDVAVAAGSANLYYMVTQGYGFLGVSGTSAGAPAFAGIAALLVQAAGGRIGCLNPALYALGRAQYAEQSAAVFRDVTQGDNTVPGVTGSRAGPGYDAASGLGSPDAAALAAALPAVLAPADAPDFRLVATPPDVFLSPGGSATVRVSLALSEASGRAAVLSVDVPPEGFSATVTPARPSAGAGIVGYVSAGVEARLTLTAADNVPRQSYTLNVTATMGNVTRRLALGVGMGERAAAPPRREPWAPPEAWQPF